MPLPFAAFLPLIASGVNAGSQLLTNASNRRTSLEMYDKQRADALADWNRNNEYNSPKAQMQRFKEAGLSPHLIYGQTNTASPVRSSSLDTPKHIAPQLDSSSVNPILIAQQIENMKKQGALMDAQAVKANSETNWKNVNTNLLKDTYDYKIGQESWKSNLIKAQADKANMDTYKTEKSISLIDSQVKKIIADTDLSVANKAKAYQSISNLITSQNLLRKKIVTEDFIQEAYAAKNMSEISKNRKLQSDMYVAQEILELKQLGLSMDVIKSMIMPMTSKNFY